MKHCKWTPTMHGLQYADALSFERHGKSLPCPAWAASNERLKQVVAAKLMRKAQMGEVLRYVPEIPTNLDFLRALESKAQEQILKHAHIKQWQTHGEIAARFGGPAALLTAIAWRRFRLGQTSPVIAESLGISPQVVRRHAASLAEIARRLYPDPELHLPRQHNSKTVARSFFEQRVFSPEGRARRSAAAKATWQRRRAAGITPYVFSAEIKARMSAAAKASWQKRRTAALALGTPLVNPASKARMSAAAKASWQKRRTAALTLVSHTEDISNGELTHAGV